MEFLAKILRCIRFTRSICLSGVMRLINIMMRIRDEIYVAKVLEYVKLHLMSFIVSWKFWWIGRIWCSWIKLRELFIKLRFDYYDYKFRIYKFSWFLFTLLSSAKFIRIQLIQQNQVYSAELWLFSWIQRNLTYSVEFSLFSKIYS